jgi:anion-transporting  ArsA/GET3 family ATPase
MRLLIFSGHSQLQQSAAALATACHAARRGQRVLLASTGPGHVIGTLLGQSLGPRPLELEPNLAAMEISAIDEIGQRWDGVRQGLRGGLVGRLRELGPDELPSFPGIDAVSALLVAERARSAGRFDLLVVDGPQPDALTRSLTLPDALRWMVRLIFGIERGPGRSRSSQETAIVPAALIAPSMTAPLQDLRIVLEEQRAALDGASGTRVRLVVAPEELRLPPLRSDLAALGLYGLAVDEVVAPGPPGSVDEAARVEFSPAAGRSRPVLRAGPLPTTPADRDEWALRGAALYHDGAVIAAAAPAAPDGRELRLHIPFLDPKLLDIAVASEEVVVRIGPLRRHVLLPGVAEGGRLRARVEGETLRLWVE